MNIPFIDWAFPARWKGSRSGVSVAGGNHDRVQRTAKTKSTAHHSRWRARRSHAPSDDSTRDTNKTTLPEIKRTLKFLQLFPRGRPPGPALAVGASSSAPCAAAAGAGAGSVTGAVTSTAASVAVIHAGASAGCWSAIFDPCSPLAGSSSVVPAVSPVLGVSDIWVERRGGTIGQEEPKLSPIKEQQRTTVATSTPSASRSL